MEIMERLAGKLPNYIHIELLGTHNYLHMENSKERINDSGYITDGDNDASSAMLEDTANDAHTLDYSDHASTCPIVIPPTKTIQLSTKRLSHTAIQSISN